MRVVSRGAVPMRVVSRGAVPMRLVSRGAVQVVSRGAVQVVSRGVVQVVPRGAVQVVPRGAVLAVAWSLSSGHSTRRWRVRGFLVRRIQSTRTFRRCEPTSPIVPDTARLGFCVDFSLPTTRCTGMFPQPLLVGQICWGIRTCRVVSPVTQRNVPR